MLLIIIKNLNPNLKGKYHTVVLLDASMCSKGNIQF